MIFVLHLPSSCILRIGCAYTEQISLNLTPVSLFASGDRERLVSIYFGFVHRYIFWKKSHYEYTHHQCQFFFSLFLLTKIVLKKFIFALISFEKKFSAYYFLMYPFLFLCIPPTHIIGLWKNELYMKVIYFVLLFRVWMINLENYFYFCLFRSFFILISDIFSAILKKNLVSVANACHSYWLMILCMS